MAAKVYHDKDADLNVLKGKTMAVLGFGSQGHAHALNLKDSGVNVIIGLYKGSKSAKVAKSKGFKVYENAEAVKRADVIFVAVPDTRQADVFKNDIEPNLTKGKTLLFSHGFAVHFKTVVPPKDVNVILVAPKGPGHIVRRQYVEGKGVPSLIAIEQNADRQAKKIALAWAKGTGGTRAVPLGRAVPSRVHNALQRLAERSSGEPPTDAIAEALQAASDEIKETV